MIVGKKNKRKHISQNSAHIYILLFLLN